MNIVQTKLKIFEKISIDAIIKKLEMLRFVPDHLKTKQMCKNTIKKLSYLMFLIDKELKKGVAELF